MLPLLALPALAGTLPVTGVTASSSAPKENGVSYAPFNVVDGRVTTAWIEGERASGLGSWVQLELGEAKVVTGLRVWNGSWASTDFWTRHNRMRDVEVQLSDGSKLPFTLVDEQAVATLTFPKPVSSTFVKLRFKSIYPGSTFGDTPIAELEVLDDVPTPVATARASTTYPADADAFYVAANVLDGKVDTLWCEGDKKDGTGQWLELDLGAPRVVARVRVHNGNAASPEENAAANQAAAITLSFDDGGVETLTLAASPAPQDLSFPAHPTQKVRVTVTAVTRGAQFDDLCFSELTFGE